VKYQQNSAIINDFVDFVLCCVLSNELFIENNFTIISTMGKIKKTKCAFKCYVKLALDTKLLLQYFLQKCLRPK